jgi:spermidine/putrescine transport system permease protein
VKVSQVASWAFVGLVVAFLFAPVVVVVLFAFNGQNSTGTLSGLSLQWFQRIYSNPQFQYAFGNTLKAAAATAVIAVIVGTAAALGLHRVGVRVRAVASGALLMPIITPGLFVGIALTLFMSKVHIPLGLPAVVIGHVLITLPLVVLIVAARIERFDMSMLEAARDGGATAFGAFRRILLPHIAPALVGGALLAAAVSLDEFIITLWTNAGSVTVPIYIFGEARFGLNPTINAIATTLLAITTFLVVIASRLVSVTDIR